MYNPAPTRVASVAPAVGSHAVRGCDPAMTSNAFGSTLCSPPTPSRLAPSRLAISSPTVPTSAPPRNEKGRTATVLLAEDGAADADWRLSRQLTPSASSATTANSIGRTLLRRH